jgi:hypothetical protein
MEKQIAIGLLLAFLVLLSGFVLLNPLYTWDLVPYAATILAVSVDDPVSLHQATYTLLENRLSEAEFNSLIVGPYASDLYQNASNFASQLDLYFSKPLYVVVLRTLYLAGVNPVDAVMLTSLLPGLIMCVLLFVWMKTMVNPLQATLLVIVIALCTRLVDLSRVPVPDNLSSLFILLGLYSLLVRKWLPAAVILTCLSVLVRTNNIMFAMLLFSLLCWRSLRYPGQWHQHALYYFAAGLLSSPLLYGLTSIIYNQQWWLLFYHTLVEPQVNIAAFDSSFSFILYLDVVINAAGQLVAPGALIATALPYFLLVLAVSMSGRWQTTVIDMVRPKNDFALVHVALLGLPVFLAFLLLFPLVANWDRFFTPFYVLIALSTLTHISSQSGRKGNASAP